ncbi:MAG: branched-chain amino acid ABC transporter permease [Nitrospinota bacterium]
MLILALVALPHFATDYERQFTLDVLMFVALAQSWNLISGFTGYVSFGHVAFFGVGAYAGALLMPWLGGAWLLAVLAGGAVAVVLALLIGFPCLRLRGAYFAIAMLGLNEIARIATLYFDGLTGGAEGLTLPPLRDPLGNYYAMLAVAALAVGAAYGVATTRFGLRLLAIREDEVAAEAMGISTTRHKMAAFLLSALFPGMAGAVYVRVVTFLDPASAFEVLRSIQMIVMVLFGGAATVWGPVAGAVGLSVLQELAWVRFTFLHQAIFGGIIILVVLLMPQGIFGLLRRWRLLVGRGV